MLFNCVTDTSGLRDKSNSGASQELELERNVFEFELQAKYVRDCFLLALSSFLERGISNKNITI